jgi:hypothetical protein
MGSWLSSYYPLLNLHRPWQSSGLENEFQLTDGDFQGVNLPKGSMKPSILVDDSDPWLGSERLHRNLFWLSDGRKFPQCVGIVRLETNCRTQPAGGDKKSIWTTCQYAKMPIMCMYGMYVCIYICIYTSVYIHISYHMPLYVSNNFNSIHHPARWERQQAFEYCKVPVNVNINFWGVLNTIQHFRCCSLFTPQSDSQFGNVKTVKTVWFRIIDPKFGWF